MEILLTRQADESELRRRVAELEEEVARLRVALQEERTAERPDDGRLWDILEAVPMIIAIHDEDTTVRYVNRSAEDAQFARSLGGSPLRWIVERDRDAYLRAFEALFETGTVQALEVSDRKGSQWSVLLAPLVGSQGQRQALSCTVDVTEHKLLEAQVRQAQKVESLGTLAGSIAHDFNNLLVAMLGNADLGTRWISEGRDPSPCFNNIREAAQRAAALCRQMLAYSGRERATLAPQDLNDTVRRMAQLMRAAVSARIELDFDLHGEMPRIHADDSQLGQIILNLITNAAEAIDKGYGRISVRTDVVDVPAGQHRYLPRSPNPGKHVLLEVTDNGPGMDARTRSLVFDPFFTSKETGHGLGLSAVLGIVRSHGAAISVDSTVGEGTTFTVLFPILGQRQEQRASVPVERASSPGFGMVMVVDDEEAVRELASEVLREEGYHVLEASDGDRALALLDEYRGRLRAVVLDVTMPRRDGFSTLKEIRMREPRLPVVLSSGRHTDAESNLADELVRFLSKPYSIDDLLGTLAEVIALRSR